MSHIPGLDGGDRDLQQDAVPVDHEYVFTSGSRPGCPKGQAEAATVKRVRGVLDGYLFAGLIT